MCLSAFQNHFQNEYDLQTENDPLKNRFRFKNFVDFRLFFYDFIRLSECLCEIDDVCGCQHHQERKNIMNFENKKFKQTRCFFKLFFKSRECLSEF